VRTDENNGTVYIFTPVKNPNTNGNEFQVSTIEERRFLFSQIKDPLSTYYVVDPGQTKVSCSPPAFFEGKVVIVASPDDCHWGKSEHKKERDTIHGIFLYFPVWTLQELLSASSVIAEHREATLSDREIGNRYYRIGGAPRTVFSDDYQEVLKTQDEALEQLSESQVLSLAFKKRSGIKTSSADLPQGILLAYTLTDTDNGTYRDGYAVLSSEFVYESIVKDYMFKLWTGMLSADESFDPYLYEAYCKKLFYDDVRPLQQLNFTCREHGTASTESRRTFRYPLSCCNRMEKVNDPVASSAMEELVLFCPISTRNQLFDFVYQEHDTFYIFQCTIAQSHTARHDHIYNLVARVVNQRLSQGNFPTNPSFRFLYMVPDFRFNEFVTEKVNARVEAQAYCKEREGSESFLYVNWNELVEILILRVPQPNASGWTRGQMD
jgi:hypothetical protein